MTNIFLNRNRGFKTFPGKGSFRALLMLLLLTTGIAAGIAWILFQYQNQPDSVKKNAVINDKVVTVWQRNLRSQQDQLTEYKAKSEQHIDALTKRLGELQARILRMEALGQRLTQGAGFEEGEFDFLSRPALGGPDAGQLQESYSLSSLTTLLQKIEENAASREQQLRLMEELIVNQKFQRERFIAGRPIVKGWISSYYGHRSDPFTGKRTWHAGVDFAGKEGSPIIAVAGGLVTAVTKKRGYGLLLEISHGAGLVTKYAHCKEALVNVGDLVQKGQAIATMGSTGRSTGPHVHFEVHKNGKTLNPIKYIRRASK